MYENNDKNKLGLIKETIKNIEKNFGKGSIMLLDNEDIQEVEVISSGSILLDEALGVKGFPKGRIIEIYGPESAGKTSLALIALAQVQSNNSKVAFIDAEHALDAQYCQKLGIKLEDFLLSQPDSGEQALEIVEMLIKSQAVEMIVVDSVAALVPQIELDGDISDQSIGAQARLMSRALRRLAPIVAKSNCCLLFINQIREKIGVIFGNPEITTGGRALRFYSSMRLEVRRGEQILNNQDIVGHKIKIKVVKNKMAPPYKTVALDFYFDFGFSIINEIIDLAMNKNIISKNGSWYNFQDLKLGQGKDKARDFLSNNEDLLNEIKLKLTI